jgi:hypothetical protein
MTVEVPEGMENTVQCLLNMIKTMTGFWSVLQIHCQKLSVFRFTDTVTATVTDTVTSHSNFVTKQAELLGDTGS